MRDFKFRAWSLDENKMFSHDEHMELGFSIGYDDLINHHNNKDFPLMQYVGKKDTKHIEIYEGDIIRANIIEWTLATMGEIVYDEEHSCYSSKNEAGLTQLLKLDRFEIIGNIYENPELLKETK